MKAAGESASALQQFRPLLFDTVGLPQRARGHHCELLIIDCDGCPIDELGVIADDVELSCFCLDKGTTTDRLV